MANLGSFAYDESYTSSGATSQYYIVKATGYNIAALCTGASGTAAAAIGVNQNNPAAGGPMTVRKFGLSKVVTGGVIAVGDPVTCSTAGTALAAATTGQYVIGRACSASTASGQTIEVFVCPQGIFMGSTA